MNIQKSLNQKISAVLQKSAALHIPTGKAALILVIEIGAITVMVIAPTSFYSANCDYFSVGCRYSHER